jgi:hypothetical protein
LRKNSEPYKASISCVKTLAVVNKAVILPALDFVVTERGYRAVELTGSQWPLMTLREEVFMSLSETTAGQG